MENSPQIRHIVAGVAAAIVIIGAIAWSLYPAPVAAPAAEGSASSTPISTATTTKDGVTANGNFTVTKDDTITLPTPPDFRAPVAFAADVAPDVRAAITTRAQALEAKLAKDSFDLGAWIDLGAMRKMAGDYRGAETAWLFVTKTAPRNTIAFSNLADLYMNFLKQYPQAETMYQKVIALDSTQIEPYVSLATLYDNLR
jgi:tetratricopeptide (TPR) repeat protein